MLTFLPWFAVALAAWTILGAVLGSLVGKWIARYERGGAYTPERIEQLERDLGINR